MKYDYLWEGGPEIAQTTNFKLGTDSVLLANYIKVKSGWKGADLGCATGAISLILLAKNPGITMTGIEINSEAAAVAQINMERNGLTERFSLLNDDLKNHRSILGAGTFDFVISNPPYFSLSSGGVSPDEARARARGEVACTLADICECASYLCRWGGTFAVVYKPERLPELFETMRRFSIEPKRLRFVAHEPSSPPSLCLVEGKRGGNPGLKTEAGLFLKNADGTDTEEIRKIYNRI